MSYFYVSLYLSASHKIVVYSKQHLKSLIPLWESLLYYNCHGKEYTGEKSVWNWEKNKIQQTVESTLWITSALNEARELTVPA